MINNIFNAAHEYMKVKRNVKADNTYYYHTLMLLNDCLSLIDFNKTVYKAYHKHDTILFLLSDNLYIALSFSEIDTSHSLSMTSGACPVYDYIIFINFKNSSESIIYTKKLIDNANVCFIDIVTNIKDKILSIKSFLYNTENQYIKSLKSAFMRTY